MITDTKLAELEALADAATPGPWDKGGLHSLLYGAWSNTHWMNDMENDEHYVPDHKDTDFLIAARTAVPELIAEVRRLRKELISAQDGKHEAELQNMRAVGNVPRHWQKIDTAPKGGYCGLCGKPEGI